MRSLFLLLAICSFAAALPAQNQRCSGPPRWLKHRLKKEAPWLVSTSLRKHLAKKSPEFASLVELQQQCRWSEAASMIDPSMADRYFTGFVSDGIPLRFIFGRHQGIWTIAIAPANTKDEMPEANLLEMTEQRWTLFHRESDGGRRVLATENY